MGGFSAVPSAAPATAPPPDSFVQELVQNISKPIDPALVRAATTPVPGAHAAQVPSSLTTPVQPHQNQPFMTGAVGRKQAKLQGIGNAITGATNALGTVVAKEAQIKQNNIKDAATKVIMAQQAIDEAKQAHDAALASGDAAGASQAQEMIQKNTQARDAIFADPKMRKALVKGFDISYTDPTANDSEEHKAVMAAMKQAKTIQEKRQIQQQQQEKQKAAQTAAGAAAGTAFEKSTPQGMSANVYAQQRLAQEQASRKAQTDVLKDYMTYKASMAGHEATVQRALIRQAQAKMALEQQNKKIQQETLKDYLNFKASIYRSDRTVDAAQIRQVGAAMLQQGRLQQQQDMQLQRFAQMERMAGIHFNDQLKLVQARATEARQTAKLIRQDKEADPLTQYTQLRKAGEGYERNYMADTKTLGELQQQRLAMYIDSKGSKLVPKDADVKALDAQIKMVHDQVELDKANADNFKNQANHLHSIYGLGEGGVSDDREGTGSSSAGASDTAGSEKYDDDSTYLNQ
jgi:hypothetical protein